MNIYFPSDLVKKRTGENWKFNRTQDQVVKMETVPGHIFLGNFLDTVDNPTNCNPFTANPIRHWRKQGVGITTDRIDIVRTKNLQNYYEKPGSSTIRTNTTNPPDCNQGSCANQLIIPDYNIAYRKNNENDYIGTLSGRTSFVNPCATANDTFSRCVAVCNPEYKARMRTRYPSRINKDNSKPKYYTTNSSYLQARCRTYAQNNFQYGTNDQVNDNCAILNGGASASSFRPNCLGCIGCPACSKRSVYKPNNCKFAVQGAVTSSGRIARLKLDTITKFAAGFTNDPNFGPNVANAYAYSGRADAPFTVKNKNFVCSTGIGRFRRTGRNINTRFDRGNKCPSA